MLTVLLVVIAAHVTAALSAVAGFGGGVLLLPVFVTVFGARDAIAVLTVAQLASNGSRVWFNRHEIDRRLVGVFAYGAVPAAAAGAWLFATAPLPALTRLIGVFLLAMVAWRLDGGHGRRASRRPRSPRSERPAASARHWSAPSAPWSPRSSSPAASSAAPTSVPKPPPRS